MTSMTDGTAVRCTCCSRKKKVAEIHGTAIEVSVRSGGTHHCHVVTIQDLLSHMAGTVTYDGVSSYVRDMYCNGL